MLPIVLKLGAMPVEAQTDASPHTETDEKLFDWCLSQFPDEDNPAVDDARLPARPVEKLRPFSLKEFVVPPDLAARTEFVGELSPPVEKYQGLWIWPTADGPPPAALFVERLTPREIAIVLLPGRDEKQSANHYEHQRMTLNWTGEGFAFKESSPEGTSETEIRISESGQAMLWVSGISRSITLEGPNGAETGAFSEAWPMCFVSSEHH